MPASDTTTENLQRIANLMNKEKIDISPYENLGMLVRKNSKEYRRRKEQQFIVLGEIEYAGEQFAYFMT
jgi:hypothetical protein